MGDEKAEENLKKIKLPKTYVNVIGYLRPLLHHLPLSEMELCVLQICDEQCV